MESEDWNNCTNRGYFPNFFGIGGIEALVAESHLVPTSDKVHLGYLRQLNDLVCLIFCGLTAAACFLYWAGEYLF